MAIVGLNVPTDIRWERVCVTRDMMDQGTCDEDRPSKWQSSIAVFKYVPEEEYQVYAGRKITYLKLSCTVCGYQPQSSEIEGEIDWDGVNVATIDDLEELLETYLPCHGALIQVTVGPREGVNVPVDQLPYIMDFQPKKRELYEAVTDTKERMSRSLEVLNTRKASGTTESLEVLDIDQGFNVGAEASAFGFGAGFEYGRQGQWGTKKLSTDELGVERTTDASRERRETESHSTQLSQLYHLFDGYHIGTNRALFFIQPRPHVLEEPTGFVRGPRPIEGIQELFLVVNQPRNQADFCISVRLDTSHLTSIDVMGYDREQTDMASCEVTVSPPGKDDPDKRQVDGTTKDITLFGEDVGDAYYDCFEKTATNAVHYTSPWEDYKIDVTREEGGYRTLVREERGGSSQVSVTPDGEALTIECEASSHICFWDSSDYPFTSSKPVDKRSGSVRRDVLVYLISREPIIPTGVRQILVVTTRGLCCCPELTNPDMIEPEGPIYVTDVGMVQLDPRTPGLGDATTVEESPRGVDLGGGSRPSPDRESARPEPADEIRPGFNPHRKQLRMSARDANALSGEVRQFMLRSVASRKRASPKDRPALASELLSTLLLNRIGGSSTGRRFLRESCAADVPARAAERLEKLFKRKMAAISRRDVLRIRSEDLARITGLSRSEVQALRLRALGVPGKGGTPPTRRGTPSTGAARPPGKRKR